MGDSCYSSPDDWTIFHLSGDRNHGYSLKGGGEEGGTLPSSPFPPRVIPRDRKGSKSSKSSKSSKKGSTSDSGNSKRKSSKPSGSSSK